MTRLYLTKREKAALEVSHQQAHGAADMRPWNKCDDCGRFIALADFDHGASRKLLTPDSHFSREEYETLCSKCAAKEPGQTEIRT